MNKLSKEKRNQLVLALVMTVAVVAGLYWFLIRHQLAGLTTLNAQKVDKQREVDKISETIKNRTQIEAELQVVNNQLQVKEEDMPESKSDLYSFMIISITKFKQPFTVDIPQFINPGGNAVAVNLLPKFPYQQYTIGIGGTAYYHDLGQFLAAFENRFPSSRVLNIELLPASTQSADDRERLSFRFDVVSLAKPGGSRSGTQ